MDVAFVGIMTSLKVLWIQAPKSSLNQRGRVSLIKEIDLEDPESVVFARYSKGGLDAHAITGVVVVLGRCVGVLFCGYSS